MRLVGRARGQVDAAQRRGDRGDGLHRAAHHQRLAVGDPSLEAAGVVGVAGDAAAAAAHRVVDLRAEQLRVSPTVAQLDGLDGGDAGHRARQKAVHAQVVLRVAAESRYDAGGAHFEGAADGVALRARLLDGVAECLFGLGVETAHR